MIDLHNNNSVDGYSKFNVILGKNGSGKSTLLRLMDKELSGKDACIRYITPERGGVLTYDGSIENNLTANPNYLPNVRRKNRWEQFRESSVAGFQHLETIVLRSIEQNEKIRASGFKFDKEVDRINEVLERVKLVRRDSAGFDLEQKTGGGEVSPTDLSSGESELISLSIEILHFAYLCKQAQYKDQKTGCYSTSLTSISILIYNFD